MKGVDSLPVLLFESSMPSSLQAKGIDLSPLPDWHPWDDYSRKYMSWGARLDVGALKTAPSRALLIGRSVALAPPCVVVRCATTCRRHVAVELAEPGYTVRDLGTTGGIYLNDGGRANGLEAIALRDGDYFSIGGWTSHRVTYFELGPDSSAPAFLYNPVD